jgi:hypothetical protein
VTVEVFDDAAEDLTPRDDYTIQKEKKRLIHKETLAIQLRYVFMNISVLNFIYIYIHILMYMYICTCLINIDIKGKETPSEVKKSCLLFTVYVQIFKNTKQLIFL